MFKISDLKDQNEKQNIKIKKLQKRLRTISGRHKMEIDALKYRLFKVQFCSKIERKRFEKSIRLRRIVSDENEDK